MLFRLCIVLIYVGQYFIKLGWRSRERLLPRAPRSLGASDRAKNFETLASSFMLTLNLIGNECILLRRSLTFLKAKT